MTTKTLSRYYGAQVRIVIAAQEKSLSGVLKPTASGKTLFAKNVIDVDAGVQMDAIAGSAARELSAAEVAAVTYAGDKTLARFFEVSLPGGTKPGDFAMKPAAKVMVYVGTSDADAEPAMQPFRIKRISEGDESLA